MYLQISSNPQAPVLISRKLHKALAFSNRNNPCGAISISQIKGKPQFALIPRTPQETFIQQCSTVHPRLGNKRTPSMFHWTTPTLEYIQAITGLQIITNRILHVTPKTLPTGLTIYILNT